MNGPGKYDDICTFAREKTDADLTMLAVLGGNKGTGFSIQSIDKKLIAVLPRTLRHMADEIEKQEAKRVRALAKPVN